MNAVRSSFTSALVLTLALATPAFAQTETPPAVTTGTVEGRVVAEATGSRLTNTEVTIVDLRRRAAVDEAGVFRFEKVPAGAWLLRAAGPAGRGVARVEVAAGETVAVEIVIDLAVSDELVVTASADPRSQLELAQPTTVITGEELDERLEATLGQTLDEQPGVTSTYFGPGASRPVIRGLGGDRIRTLQGGIGSGDAANTSPDHAVSLDPLSAERIEILRGPSTLLYGSSAVGGVVNVLDERIPDYVPERAVSGELQVLGGSVSDERSGAVSLVGGAGRLAWHADYSRRETDDYEIPGRAAVDVDEEHGEEAEPEGVLENSALENESAGFGASYVTERGFLGVSVSGFDTLYGVPGHGHGEKEHGHEEEEERIRIDLDQRRVDLRGETLLASRLFSGLKVRFGTADYEHVELEGEEVGTRFLNDSWEGRFELVQRKRDVGAGALSGSLGMQVSCSDFEAIGEEAFVPPSVTDDWAVFGFQEIERGPLSYQLGLRWENREIDADAGPANAAASRSFDGVSGSLGLVWRFADGYSFTTSLSRTERLPTATELYADGPHAATRAFEIGDPDLDSEESVGLDVSLKGAGERLTGSLSLFYNDFSGYVYESFTGDVEDGLEVVRFVQRDAEFVGAEVDLVFRLAEIGTGHLDLRARGDVVRAELADGTPLPRIPPLRLGAGLTWHQGPWHALAELRWTDDQDRLGANEAPTDGSTVLNASTSYRFFLGATVTDLMLRGTNLTDEEVRNHVSFLKDEVPLPGRDVSLLLRVAF